MAGLRVFLTRLLSIVRTRYGNAALDEELRHHAELLTEKLVAGGLSPEAAALEVRRQLGSVARTTEAYREQRGLPVLEHVITDIRHSCRGLLRAPSFAVITIVTLGLGIGATTLVFTVIYGVLFRPLPYRNADRIVEIVQVIPRPTGEPSRGGLQDEQVRSWRSTSRTLTNLAFYGGGASITLTTGAETVRLNGGLVSPALFGAFGVEPVLGRAFRTEEELPGHERVVMLSAPTWTRYFGGDPGILDQPITVNGLPYRVVGVMPQEFTFPPAVGNAVNRDFSGRLNTAPEFWLPTQLNPPPKGPNQGFTLRPTLGRLREGVSLEQAIAEANTLVPPMPDGTRVRIEVVGLQDEMVRDVRPLLLLFQTAVAFVLLIACINVINLMLARATHGRRELAIRVALGAGSLQIARRVIAEAMVLAVAGGVAGSLLTFAAMPVLHSLPPDTMPRLDAIRVDTPVLMFVSVLAVLLGLSVGLFVAVRVLRAHPWQWLREIRSSTAGAPIAGRNRPSSALVIVEIAAAMVLLAGSGLLLNSFARLARIDPGFEATSLVTFKVGVPVSRYPTNAQQQTFASQLLASLRATPGVEGVALGDNLPFQPGSLGSPLILGGNKHQKMIGFRFIAPGFFGAFGVPVTRGREFTDDDRPGQPGVVVVNEAFARTFFGDTNPVGEIVRFQESGPLQIVGVVGDTKRGRLSADAEPEINFPFQQPLTERAGSTTIAGAVRMAGDPLSVVPSVRRAVKDLDPTLAVHSVTTMSQMVAESYAESRFYALTASVFGSVALMLAAIGLYGVLTYSVASRTREFGIRMALGADSRRIIKRVIREGLTLTVLGLGIGIGGALLVSQVLAGLLFGITPQDPATLAAVAVLFVAVASLACYLPARRATKIDPVVALSVE